MNPKIQVTQVVLDVDGSRQVVDVGGSSTAGPQAEYDENGFSLEGLYGGVAVRSQKVDQVAAAMALGDKFDRQVVAEAAGYFAMQVPGREYTRDQILLIDRSRPEQIQVTTGLLGGMRFQPFYPDSTPSGSGPGQNQGPNMVLGDPADGVVCPVDGDKADDDWEDAPDEYIHLLRRKAAKLRRDAKNAQEGKTGPKVSPGG